MRRNEINRILLFINNVLEDDVFLIIRLDWSDSKKKARFRYNKGYDYYITYDKLYFFKEKANFFKKFFTHIFGGTKFGAFYYLKINDIYNIKYEAVSLMNLKKINLDQEIV